MIKRDTPLMEAVVKRLMFRRLYPVAAVKNKFSVQFFHVMVLFHPSVHLGLACPLMTRSSEVGEVVSVPSAFW